MSNKRGQHFNMVFGRFQPFHLGHLNLVRVVARLPDPFVVGVTNPDPTVIKPEPTRPERHLANLNPFTYFDRMRMVQAALIEDGIPLERCSIVPLAVNTPEVWRYYLPENLTAYVPMFDESQEPTIAWQRAKLERFKSMGYGAKPIDELEKVIHATDVRVRIARGEPWRGLCPKSVEEIIQQLLDAGREVTE